MKRAVIAAGGTGGHMFPAQSLAEALLASGWEVSLSTDSRGARYAGGFPDAVMRDVVSAGTTGRGGLLAKLGAPLRIAIGVLSATIAFARNRPDIVVGFGGYPAFPAMSAAWLLRIPSVIHEQNGVLGRVNTVFARRVSKVACSVWPTQLPAQTNAVHTGNPVRSGIRAAANAPYPSMDGKLTLLVFGGSQGASILSDVVPEAVRALPEALRTRLTIVQQAREADLDAVVNAYQEMNIPAKVASFLDDMPAHLTAAHLVIARAGASSVADIAVVGRPAIFVPLAIAIRDEQTANARGLTDAGAALTVPESELDPAALSSHIAAILGDPAHAADMAFRAAKEGRPDAVDRLIEVVTDVAGT